MEQSELASARGWRRVFLAVFFAALILLPSSAALAQSPSPVVLFSEVHCYDLIPHIEYLEDTEGSLAVGEVASAALFDRFRPVDGPFLKFGATNSVYWFRFRVCPPAKKRADHPAWILEIDRAWLPRADLYVPQVGSDDRLPYVKIRPAMADDHSDGVLRTRSILFTLPNDFVADEYFYLTLATQGPPLNVGMRLRTQTDYQRWAVADFFIFGGVYGILLVMIFYNIILYLSLRDRVFLYYVFYILSMGMYLAGSYGHLLIFTPALPKYLGVLYVYSGTAIFGAALFCKTFLSTKKTTPAVDRLLSLCMVLALTGSVLGAARFHQSAQVFLSYLGLAFPLVAILAGIFALAKGYRPAIFYLAAWSLLLGAGVLWAARGAGLLGQTGFVTYVFPLATALESVLLSFALTNRIRAMRLKMEKMQTEERRLLELSVTDGLTGLFNKRYMQSKLDSEVEHARRLGLPLSLLFLDVDDFKRFNDTYGHQAGDRVLETLSAILRSNSRPSDSCCRYGGEEFVAILPGADPKAALAAAERIRQAFAGVKFHPQNGRPESTGVSVGLAHLEPGETAESLFRRADEALYQAKRSGKNRTVVAQVREPDVPGFPIRRTSPG